MSIDSLVCKPGEVQCKSRLVGILGLIGSGTMLFGTAFALISYPGGYDILNQFVSEMGLITLYGGAWVFNVSIVIGSAFLILFGIAMAASIDSKIVSIISMLVSTIAIASVLLLGIYPADVYPSTHKAITMVSFLGLFLTAITFSLTIIVQKVVNIPKAFAAFLLVPFVCNIVLIVLSFADGFVTLTTLDYFDPRPDVSFFSIFEWLSVYTFIGWVVAVSIYEMS